MLMWNKDGERCNEIVDACAVYPRTEEECEIIADSINASYGWVDPFKLYVWSADDGTFVKIDSTIAKFVQPLYPRFCELD